MAQLNDDCLLLVFDRLSPDLLFKLLRVNRQLNRLATYTIQRNVKAISLNDSINSLFSSCAHLDSAIARDQVLVLGPKFQRKTLRPLLLTVLAKCVSVKCIDFGCYQNLPADLLLEVIRRCPQLECIKLGKSVIEFDYWDRVFDEIGDQIVHLEKGWFVLNQNFDAEHQLLKLVALKCPNLKQLNFHLGWRLTEYLLTLLEMLSKNCWVTIDCVDFDDNFVLKRDVIDQLDIDQLNWPSIDGRRFNRLSKLKVKYIQLNQSYGPVHGVDFARLKKFELYSNRGFTDPNFIGCLLASRFPLLEEFCFNACDGFTEEDYSALFARMELLKKLTIMLDIGNFGRPYDHEQPRLPGLAVHQLKNLDTIEVEISHVKSSWHLEHILPELEMYVDEVGSLNKLTVDKRFCGFEWEKTLEDQVTRLKLKQNRVEVVWFGDSENEKIERN